MQPENKREYKHIESELRSFDPLETVAPGYDDAELLGIVENDIWRIDTMLENDRTLTADERTDLYEMGANLRLDWLYAEGGGKSLRLSEFTERANEAKHFIKKGADDAESQGEAKLQDKWALDIKKLDLSAVVAQRFYKESQTVLRGTKTGKETAQIADGLMRNVLLQSVDLMGKMKKYANGPEKMAQDTRGTLYEVMLMTFARMQTYESQEFDTVLVRSALSREDRPWIGHPTPKHSFDIVIDSGDTKRLLQAKNHRNDDDYDTSIEKIEDTHFGRTLDDINKYIADFDLLLENSSDPNKKIYLDRAYRHLDDVFGSQLKEPNYS